jgi:hypothetical protein
MIENRILETDLAKYEFENSILIIKFKAGLFVDQPTMELLLNEAVNFTNHQKYFAIIDLTNNIDSTYESRNYYAENGFNKYRLADAFVVNSLYLQSLTNFYFKFKKPKIPSKMFNDLESAKKWVESLKELQLTV